MNDELKRFYNIHYGQDCIIYGCGPSIKDFDINKLNLKDPVKIGMKLNILSNQTNDMKYYFFGDNNEKSNSYKDIIKNLNCIKFGLVLINGKENHRLFSKNICINYGAIPCSISKSPKFIKDISKDQFYQGMTLYPALQFALYCGFLNIYLVGFDLDINKSFLNDDKREVNDFLKNESIGLQFMKRYIDLNYNNTNIIHINPVNKITLCNKSINLKE